MTPDYMARAARMLDASQRSTLATVSYLDDVLTTALVAARLAGIRPVDVDRMLALCQDRAARLAP